jgi:hypothetical protein
MVRAANAMTTDIEIAIRGEIWNAFAISDSSDPPFCSSEASGFALEPLSAFAKEDSVARGSPKCEFTVLAGDTLTRGKYLGE